MTISILMFCPQFRPIVGGTERQAEKLARALATKGIQVRILTPRFSSDTLLWEEEDGVEIVRFPLFNLRHSIPWLRGLGPFNLLLLQWQVMRAVSVHLGKADLVHAHIASPMTAFAMQAAHKSGVPVICKIASASKINDFSQTAGIGLGGKQICSSMIKGITKWIAITRPVAEVLKQWQAREDSIVFIPNGVETPQKRQREPTVLARNFLYLGRLSANSNRDVPTVICSFERLADSISDVELTLVGDGDQFHEIAVLVANSRHCERITMPGFQEPDQWLQWADCFLLPSRSEGLSNALLEAMSYGLACIANDIPPNREVLNDGEAGILVPVEDADNLFSAMQSVAEDEHLGSSYGHAAMQRVKNTYSIESVADQYVELYKEIMASN